MVCIHTQTAINWIQLVAKWNGCASTEVVDIVKRRKQNEINNWFEWRRNCRCDRWVTILPPMGNGHVMRELCTWCSEHHKMIIKPHTESFESVIRDRPYTSRIVSNRLSLYSLLLSEKQLKLFSIGETIVVVVIEAISNHKLAVAARCHAFPHHSSTNSTD